MNEKLEEANRLSHEVIGAAIEVHRIKGPGLMESVYQKCLMREFELRNIRAERESIVKLEYKGLVFDDVLKMDFLINKCLVVELKAVETVLPVHKAQVLSYMKLINAPLGLLINFHELYLKNGVHRLILQSSLRSL